MLNKKITHDDILNCWPHASYYLKDILNEEYDLYEAIEDIKSLIGSKYDPRIKDILNVEL